MTKLIVEIPGSGFLEEVEVWDNGDGNSYTKYYKFRFQQTPKILKDGEWIDCDDDTLGFAIVGTQEVSDFEDAFKHIIKYQ